MKIKGQLQLELLLPCHFPRFFFFFLVASWEATNRQPVGLALTHAQNAEGVSHFVACVFLRVARKHAPSAFGGGDVDQSTRQNRPANESRPPTRTADTHGPDPTRRA